MAEMLKDTELSAEDKQLLYDLCKNKVQTSKVDGLYKPFRDDWIWDY